MKKRETFSTCVMSKSTATSPTYKHNMMT